MKRETAKKLVKLAAAAGGIALGSLAIKAIVSQFTSNGNEVTGPLDRKAAELFGEFTQTLGSGQTTVADALRRNVSPVFADIAGFAEETGTSAPEGLQKVLPALQNGIGDSLRRVASGLSFGGLGITEAKHLEGSSKISQARSLHSQASAEISKARKAIAAGKSPVIYESNARNLQRKAQQLMKEGKKLLEYKPPVK